MNEARILSQSNLATILGVLLWCASCGSESADHSVTDSPGAAQEISAVSAGAPAPSSTLSPYANQAPSPIRGLSAQEYDDLQNGRGMGMARAAELNSYPGPRHVLDLRTQLQIDDRMATEIESIYAKMDADARRVGAEVLAKEQLLNDAFASGTASDGGVAQQLAELGDLYGQLRGVHVLAHLAVQHLLTAAQIRKYNELRGYSTSSAHAMHHGS